MRILMLSARYLPFAGGTETHMREVGVRLAEHGHHVTVLTGDPTGALPNRENRDGVEVRRVRAYPRGKDWCFAPDVFRQVRQGDWDLMHVQGYHTFMAPFGMTAALLNKLPFVVTFHSGGHSSAVRTSMRSAQHAALGPLVSRAARLIGVSQFETDLFSRRMRIPRERFTVVPNGARLPVASGKMSFRGPLIVSLGRLERYKGHHRALEAFARLRSTLPDARLRILGEGPYEGELRRRVGALGLDAHVDIGSIPASERGAMADLLSSAALVVLLSDYEAHPVAVMEALSLNVPVLTSDTSGFRELAERGLVRALPLNADPGRIAEEMRVRIAEGPSSTPVVLPDWDECTDKLVAVYSDVLRRRMKQPADRARLETTVS